MQRVWATLGVSALLVGAAPTMAQEKAKDLSVELLKLVIDRLHSFNCGEAKCAPATAEEKANPPIAEADANRIVERGMLSAYGMHCGLDWEERNFHPMMAYWRHGQKRPVREMALIGGLHGASKGVFLETIKGQGACTAEMKAAVDARLDFKPEAMK